MHPLVRCLILIVLLAATPTVPAEEFFVKNGDRVVMIGDSITEQHLYSTYVELWTVTFSIVGVGL